MVPDCNGDPRHHENTMTQTADVPHDLPASFQCAEGLTVKQILVFLTLKPHHFKISCLVILACDLKEPVIIVTVINLKRISDLGTFF